MIVKSTDKIRCPACGEEQEGEADDYVIPGRIGNASAASEQCGYCDEWFSVIRLPDGMIEIEEEDVDELLD